MHTVRCSDRLPGVSAWGWVSVQGEVSAGGGCLPDTPTPCEQNHRCKNITLPQLRYGR